MKPDTKTCTKCGGVFAATAEYFNRNRRTKDGLKPHCKKCSSEYDRLYYGLNRERYSKQRHGCYAKNPEKYRAIAHRRWHTYQKAIPRVRLSRNISRNIHLAIRENKNGRHWESLVGYTLEELIAHIEMQFAKGMTWANYGAWHIDHIRPVSDFHFNDTDDSEFKQCWSLWNLQPLWGKENLLKGSKCKEPPLPLRHS